MPVKRYYKIRIAGTEDYWNDHKVFGPAGKAKLFTKQAAVQWYRYWHSKLPHIDSVEVVEYDLIEVKITNTASFFKKYSKSPIVST